MLIDKWLPAFDFKEFHAVELTSSANDVYQKMLHADLSNSSLIKFLFRLRGISRGAYSIAHLSNMGFIKLEEEPGKEIVFGRVTDSPMFNTCQSNISPTAFIQKTDASIIKAVINFKLQDDNNGHYIISTETRICCGSKQMRSKFKWYWLFIKPFSGLIRRAMLKQMKKLILKAAATAAH